MYATLFLLSLKETLSLEIVKLLLCSKPGIAYLDQKQQSSRNAVIRDKLSLFNVFFVHGLSVQLLGILFFLFRQ